jgi:hypothetical protein
MKRLVAAVIAGTALAAGGVYALWPREARPVAGAPGSRPAAQATAAAEPAERLELRELLEPGPVLKPSVKAVSLTGKRVRLVGFMAQMELPPKGGFYLVPRPLHVDEAGSGTADLPPDSVLVVSRSTAGQTLPFMQGALEVTGILEIGNRADEDGRVSAIRLLLDGAPISNPRETRER